MTADRLKFRCYQCNQLLAVAPTKAGSTVACPKCKAELAIPDPEGSPRPEASLRKSAAAVSEKRDDRSSKSAELPDFLQAVEPEIPPEVAELRPEDLRVEAEFFANLTRPPLTVEAESSSSSAVVRQEAPWPAPAAPVPRIETPIRSERIPVVPPEPAPAPPPREQSSILVSESIVPSIQIDTPTSLAPVESPRTVREVVLPASVVLAWSLFVLVGIAVSFLAGLMVGHFLWRHV